ncbi:MAG: hypothetical protein AABW65_00420 [Nanoarchaeota archaeon]
MFFNRKQKKEICAVCNSGIENKYSFCPYCGISLVDLKKQKKEFGLLGKNDNVEGTDFKGEFSSSFGISDKMILSLINNLAKNFEKQFRDLEKAEISHLPNGINIKIGVPANNRKKIPKQKPFYNQIKEEQIKKITSLPKTSAKTNIKRLGNKVIYELNAPGIISTEDVFLSKLENGYEVKAIGEKKVYINTLPINLPIHSYSINNNKLTIEFSAQEE